MPLWLVLGILAGVTALALLVTLMATPVTAAGSPAGAGVDAANGANTHLPVEYTWDTDAPAAGYLLDLGDGRFAFYEHLKHGSVRVKPGERVKRGQEIAAVGNSGSSGSLIRRTRSFLTYRML